MTVLPRQLAATVKAVPYRLEDIGGSVTYRAAQVTFNDVTARHGDGKIRLNGSGTVGNTPADAGRSVWDLKLAAEDVTVDEAFRKALPAALADMAEALKLKGKVAFDFSKLRVTLRDDLRRSATAPAVASAAGAKPDASIAPPPPVDVDFAVKVATSAASLDVGVPLTDVQGLIDIAGAVREGRLLALAGTLGAPSLSIASRPATDFSADIIKSPGGDDIEIGPMRGRLAGGELAGDVTRHVPRTGTSRYELNLILREADVRTIAADATDRDVNGRLTASLALEGEWSGPNSRRGRGSVGVTGQEMYKIPLVLGLLQITNLALPINSPFNEASVDYSVDGQRVTAEAITLRSKDMLMQGSGYLDFGTKRVRMSFTTDNPNWPKLPIVHELMQGAKNELLRIQVKGTLQEPKVSASPMNTFTTTVDEVLRGNGEKD